MSWTGYVFLHNTFKLTPKWLWARTAMWHYHCDQMLLCYGQTDVLFITDSESKHHWEPFRPPQRPLLSPTRGTWGRARGLSKNLWIMNITNLSLNFKQPMCTMNMWDIEFQTFPQSDIKPAWIGVSFMGCTYVRPFIRRPYGVFLFLLLPQYNNRIKKCKCLIIWRWGLLVRYIPVVKNKQK